MINFNDLSDKEKFKGIFDFDKLENMVKHFDHICNEYEINEQEKGAIVANLMVNLSTPIKDAFINAILCTYNIKE